MSESKEQKAMRALPGGGVKVDFVALDAEYDDHLTEGRELGEWSPPSLAAPYGQWQTQDGRTLSIAEMADRHLQNAISLFSKFGYGDHDKIQEMRRELAQRMRKGIELTLQGLSGAAWLGRLDTHVYAKMLKLTHDCVTRKQTVEAIASYVRTACSTPPDPSGIEAILPPLLMEPPSKDADDVCLLTATLLLSAGVRCRFVAARFDRSWTCLVDYETDNGPPEAADRQWETVPIGEHVDREPDERVVGPIPGGAP
jgi:hypothetical protein